jgi:CBS domain-containing protein
MKRKSQDMKIADVMTINPDWCIPQTPATQAARIMKDTNVAIVPVVDSESGRHSSGSSRTGIIQRSNLSPDLTHHILRKVTEPTEEASRPRAQMKRAA